MPFYITKDDAVPLPDEYTHARSRSQALCSSHKLRRRTTARAGPVVRWQHAESSVGLLVDAHIMREDRQQVKARLNPAKRPLRRSQEFHIAEASYNSESAIIFQLDI